MPQHIVMYKQRGASSWDFFTEPLNPQPAPEPEPTIAQRLFGGAKEKPMTKKRVHILRCIAWSRGLAEPHQVLDLPADVADALIAGGSARLAPNEDINFLPKYDPA